MKKMFAILCVLTLCLTAISAVAAELTMPGLFTVTYDETVFQPESLPEGDPEEANVTFLFMLSNDDVVFEGESEVFDNEFSELTLSADSAENIQAYIDYFLDTYAGEDARYNETILTAKENIPFCVFTLADDEGDYYYASTIIDGLGIGFYGYYSELNKAPDAELDELYFAFLQSFVSAK